MVLYGFAMRAAVLLIPFLCAEAIFAQTAPVTDEKGLDPVQMGIAPESKYHHCFEPPQSAKEAIRRLPTRARSWLDEDAVYIVTAEERCTYLHLETDEERSHFIEQFWYRRDVDPISLDYDFKAEHYRRIAYANETYGGQITGWKTDRGRIHVLFGAPDSVEVVADALTRDTEAGQSAETRLHPPERWHYRYIKGLGADAQFNFIYRTSYKEYALREEDNERLGQADPNPDRFPVTPEHLQLYIVADQPRQIRFKDLEAIVTSQVVREQVKFSQRVEFFPATRATTLVRIDMQIACESCTHEGQIAPSLAYPLFVRVFEPSGRVVDTVERTAELVVHDKRDAKLYVEAQADFPLAAGTYELAMVAKNVSAGEVGVVRTRVVVPTYEALMAKNARAANHGEAAGTK
jgi:GWxTD domain-containing protein